VQLRQGVEIVIDETAAALTRERSVRRGERISGQVLDQVQRVRVDGSIDGRRRTLFRRRLAFRVEHLPSDDGGVGKALPAAASAGGGEFRGLREVVQA